MDSSLQYIQDFYHMPWLRAGLTADMDGKRGPVVGFALSSAHVLVQFDGQDFPGICHPQWAMTYYDEQGAIVADYKEDTEPCEILKPS